MSALMRVGNATLKVIGLTPAEITQTGEARVAGQATFSGMDYQLTGSGETVLTIEAETMPIITGGLDAIGWIIRHCEANEAVNLIRLGRNYLGQVEGQVAVRSYDLNEGKLHPFTGVGRHVRITAELVRVG